VSGISLVVTIFNEADSIDQWLRSLLGQTRQPDEIVIVDGGSQDGTLDVVRRAAAREPRIHLIVEPGCNISQGRNRGIEAARGPLVAVTDAGTRLEADWLEAIVTPLEDNDAVDVVAGFFRPDGRSDFERVLASVITPRLSEIDPARFLPSSRSVAFRKAIWATVGGYPEWLRTCEDLVFDMRLKEVGARFEFAPGAIVRWYPRPTLRHFFHQYRHYAKGDGHAHLFLRRHLLRYGAYVTGAALVAVSKRHRWAAAALAIGLGGHLRRYVWRLWEERPFDKPERMAAATALVPLIVIAGDVAKMIGYPQGLWERARTGGPEGLAAASGRSHRSLEALGDDLRRIPD
jgi:glycosyltransferase involved in cell wall biosynthesis